ncbi:hypothetical protein SEPCBS119000_005616 [Sporothrix epigloea]|uniref:Uncharacterized protein n=1 Tax=Sporothrix epigloea TaxID=1892477 RepID=A0ABP0DYT5_9PEZI
MHLSAGEVDYWRAGIAENGFANAYNSAAGNNHPSACGWYSMQDLVMSLPNGQSIPESFRGTQLGRASL